MTNIDKPTDAEPKGNALTLETPQLDEYVCASGSQPYLDYEEIKKGTGDITGVPTGAGIKETIPISLGMEKNYNYQGTPGGVVASSDEGDPETKFSIGEYDPPVSANAGYGDSTRVHVLCPPANGADRSGASAKPALVDALPVWQSGLKDQP